MDHTSNHEVPSVPVELREPLLRFIRGRVGKDADAEDILQDVFLRMHKNVDSLNDIESVSGWVYRVTRNAITDHHRAQAKARRDADRLSDPRSTGTEVTDPNLGADEPRTELARCMRPLMQALPDVYAEALTLVELEGMTQKEAAARAEVSLSGMKSRVQRGRRMLRGKVLDCCHVELDRLGGVVDYTTREVDCVCGDPSPDRNTDQGD